jgi:hypothetical protein
MIRWLHKPLALLAALALLLFFLWALAALYFDAGAWFPLALLALAAGAVIVLRSARGTALVVLVGCATVLAWWYTLSATKSPSLTCAISATAKTKSST